MISHRSVLPSDYHPSGLEEILIPPLNDTVNVLHPLMAQSLRIRAALPGAGEETRHKCDPIPLADIVAVRPISRIGQVGAMCIGGKAQGMSIRLRVAGSGGLAFAFSRSSSSSRRAGVGVGMGRGFIHGILIWRRRVAWGIEAVHDG